MTNSGVIRIRLTVSKLGIFRVELERLAGALCCGSETTSIDKMVGHRIGFTSCYCGVILTFK
jgi:hypothetical protein